MIDKVIKGDYCIGCGVCASLDYSPFEMQLTLIDKYEPKHKNDSTVIDKETEEKLSKICPFANDKTNEDVLSTELYNTTGDDVNKDIVIGYYRSLYAGYVKNSNFREQGSSGGFGSWILSYLLQNNLVDNVVHVRPNQSDNILFKYQISSTLEEVQNGAKSKYYPIELSSVIKKIREKEGRYVLVGIPCFIKAVRLLMKQDPILNERIKYTVGLVCGHLKSASFAKMLGWQCGVNPDDLQSIDFRVKLEGLGANEYGISAKKKDITKKIISPPISQLYGSNWGYGYFKYNACDYCDDVLAETSDITIGDAWLPQYLSQTMGTNIVIVRNKELDSIIKDALNNDILHLESISVDDVIKSQSAGVSHRREGLSYRLYLKDEAKIWRPNKRVKSGIFISEKRQKIQKLRLDLAKKSHTAFSEAVKGGQFAIFINQMNPLLSKYKKLYKRTLWDKISNRLKRILQIK